MNLKFIEISLLITRRQRIRYKLRTKGKVEAVRLHMSLFGRGLRAANEYVSALEVKGHG